MDGSHFVEARGLRILMLEAGCCIDIIQGLHAFVVVVVMSWFNVTHISDYSSSHRFFIIKPKYSNMPPSSCKLWISKSGHTLLLVIMGFIK